MLRWRLISRGKSSSSSKVLLASTNDRVSLFAVDWRVCEMQVLSAAPLTSHVPCLQLSSYLPNLFTDY
jgi:hypothetical protein